MKFQSFVISNSMGLKHYYPGLCINLKLFALQISSFRLNVLVKFETDMKWDPSWTHFNCWLLNLTWVLKAWFPKSLTWTIETVQSDSFGFTCYIIFFSLLMIWCRFIKIVEFLHICVIKAKEFELKTFQDNTYWKSEKKCFGVCTLLGMLFGARLSNKKLIKKNK